MPTKKLPAALAPLDLLIETRTGRSLALPRNLARLYGGFRMQVPRSRPLVFSNFVSTLDGVVSLQAMGHDGGGDISGFSVQDRMVMGLLRAIADVVVVGSGTLEADPRHVWTPEAICPELADDYRKLRQTLAMRAPSLNVVVSASGRLDLRMPVFASGRVPALIITTKAGAKRLSRHGAPSAVEIRAIPGGGDISARAVLQEVSRVSSGKSVLVEGGPHLLGYFYKERLMDEQYLTIAPQIAGRKPDDGRLSLVMGATFAPRDPLWGTLVDARRGNSHLFLRYVFPPR